VSKPRSGTPEVPRITSVPEPLADDVARRTRRYLLQMGFRLVCFLVAVITWGHIPRPISWALLLGAVVLPYIAVLLANGGRERRDDQVGFVAPRPPRSIGTAPGSEDGPRD